MTEKEYFLLNVNMKYIQNCGAQHYESSKKYE